ncbi:conserved hypothetical protein, partial [Ricinus communis]
MEEGGKAEAERSAIGLDRMAAHVEGPRKGALQQRRHREPIPRRRKRFHFDENVGEGIKDRLFAGQRGFPTCHRAHRVLIVKLGREEGCELVERASVEGE